MYTYKELRDSVIFFDPLEIINLMYLRYSEGWASVLDMMNRSVTFDGLENDDDEIEKLLESDFLYEYSFRLEFDFALNEKFMELEELRRGREHGRAVPGGMDKRGGMGTVDLVQVISTMDIINFGFVDTRLRKVVFYMFLIFIYIP